MLTSIGMNGVLSIVSHILFIGLAWWALQAINYEKLLRPNHVAQARLLFIFLAITIGTAVSNFFLDYFLWSVNLQYIFN